MEIDWTQQQHLLTSTIVEEKVLSIFFRSSSAAASNSEICNYLLTTHSENYTRNIEVLRSYFKIKTKASAFCMHARSILVVVVVVVVVNHG